MNGHLLQDASQDKSPPISRHVMTSTQEPSNMIRSQKVNSNKFNSQKRWSIPGHLSPDARLDKSQPILKLAMISILVPSNTTRFHHHNSIKFNWITSGHPLLDASQDKSPLISRHVTTLTRAPSSTIRSHHPSSSKSNSLTDQLWSARTQWLETQSLATMEISTLPTGGSSMPTRTRMRSSKPRSESSQEVKTPIRMPRRLGKRGRSSERQNYFSHI